MSAANSPIGIVGGGGFGQALAAAVRRRERLPRIWSRRNPGSTVAEMSECELIFICVPSMHVATVADELGRVLDGRHLLVHVSRGLLGDELHTVSRELRARTPCRRVGCLAGPINATTLGENLPGGGIIGTGFPEVVHAVRDAIASPYLRLYHTEDVAGVEVASALVGLMALTIGYASALELNPTAIALLAARGMREVQRVGVALGGHEQTFVGVAGYGDLLAAVAGDERPEVLLGRAIGQGLSLEEAGRAAGAYIEGVTIARRVQRFAHRRGIEVPVAEAVAEVIEGKLDSTAVVQRLMARRTLRE